MTEISDSPFRLGHSFATDARQAAREFHAAVDQPDLAAVLFFCASDYALAALADELNLLFGDILLMGCTTAGEFGPAGYLSHSISGVSFSSRAGTVVGDLLPDLDRFEPWQAQAFVDQLRQRESLQQPVKGQNHSFAFLMIDGLSEREEIVARSLQAALGATHLCGGSSGDGLRFASTHVFHGGKFLSNCAAVLMLNTSLAIRIFKTAHLVTGSQRLLITDADAEQRLVKEINGRPAAEEYARLLGLEVADLNPSVFSEAPLVVLIDGTSFVRSIKNANPDGSLKFYCAIETGRVFRIAYGEDMYANLAKTFATLREDIGPPSLVIGCDCILRNLEMNKKQLTEQIGALLRENNAVGFGSYGEQFGGVHINQTFTGIAIASPAEKKS